MKTNKNMKMVISVSCSHNKPVKGRKINWMKAGIIESNRVITVSPHYAQELVSGEAKGVELDSTLRNSGITGIVNGMDVQEWNPATDKYIDIKYTAETVSLLSYEHDIFLPYKTVWLIGA